VLGLIYEVKEEKLGSEGVFGIHAPCYYFISQVKHFSWIYKDTILGVCTYVCLE